jgi:hypothetical protein
MTPNVPGAASKANRRWSEGTGNAGQTAPASARARSRRILRIPLAAGERAAW